MESGDFTYKTVAAEATGIFKDRGSKFLGYCFPVQDEAAIKVILKTLKNQHPKANHHCFAWRLGTEKLFYRVNDNGEPSGSAGWPILGQIDSAGLVNVLIVVVRYFGGTLLGLPGLINAYKTAAANSLSNAGFVEKELTFPVDLHFDYTCMNEVMQLVKKYEAEIKKQETTLFCDYEIAVPIRHKAAFLTHCGNLRNIEIKVKNGSPV